SHTGASTLVFNILEALKYLTLRPDSCFLVYCAA
ncbi:unnamed protein product, partial [Amoebophrya sp. A120]